MKTRIKALRQALGWTQVELAEKVGLKRSTIASYETGVSSPNGAIIKTICETLGVREAWLRYGKGDMYQPPATFSLDSFCAEHGATELEIEFVKAYFSLHEETRRDIMQNFSKVVLGHAQRTSEANAVPNPHEMTREDLLAEVERQLDAEAAAQEMGTGESSTSGPGSSGTAAG